MRRGEGPDVPDLGGGGTRSGALAPPPVSIDVCRCGCRGDDLGHHVDEAPPEPEWALATAWAFLTRPVEDRQDEEPAPADLPWWDARSEASRRRAVLPLVLLGELQAGVLLRAVWEVLQRGSGPAA